MFYFEKKYILLKFALFIFEEFNPGTSRKKFHAPTIRLSLRCSKLLNVEIYLCCPLLQNFCVMYMYKCYVLHKFIKSLFTKIRTLLNEKLLSTLCRIQEIVKHIFNSEIIKTFQAILCKYCFN